MARTEVSTVIQDIIEAFQNGVKLSKGEGRRHRRHQSEPANTNEDKHIRDSLTKRPQEIKQAYEQSVVKHGRQFEVGDATSQVTLAQILLSFNTGLVKLLNHALSRDSKRRLSPTTSLLNLSESVGLETLSALSELNNRLTSCSKLCLPQSLSPSYEDTRSKTVNQVRGQSTVQAHKRPPPNPRLKNGGWVRSKSDPSVVSVIVSKKTKNESRRGSTSRSPSSPPLKTATVCMSPKRQTYEKLIDGNVFDVEQAPVVKPKPKHLHNNSTLPPVEEQPTPDRALVRHPSMYIVPSDFFDMFPQLSEDSDILPPMVPPKVPHHSRPRPNAVPEYRDEYHKRARPTSMMTFMTTSTKIGEIPEHKLPDRKLTPEQQEEMPMPYVVPAMLNPSKKRTPRTLKFWKKDNRGKETIGSVVI